MNNTYSNFKLQSINYNFNLLRCSDIYICTSGKQSLNHDA